MQDCLGYIFVDLDNVLISTDTLPRTLPDGSTARAVWTSPDVDRDGQPVLYYAIVRPSALDVLQQLRQLAPVKMLTTAVRDYALYFNDQLHFGFDPADVIARENFISVGAEVGAYGTHVRYEVKPDELAEQAIGDLPNHLLIDDLRYNENRLKVKLLNLMEYQYFHVQPFDDVEWEHLFADLQDTVDQIKQLLGK